MLIFNCKIHGTVKAHSSGKFPRCSICNSARVRERHRRQKIMAVEYKGGKCEDCGYTGCPAVFDFHHLDPTTKDFTPAVIMKRSFDLVKKELDKCVLLCANCHRVRHYEEGLVY